MDQISGLMPQIGWSPLLAVAMPKKAPASTVEPVSATSDTSGGMGAQIDTKTPHDHAARARIMAALAQDGNENPIWPDPPGQTGPEPTFDTTPLEANAEELKSARESGTDLNAATDPLATDPLVPEIALPEIAPGDMSDLFPMIDAATPEPEEFTPRSADADDADTDGKASEQRAKADRVESGSWQPIGAASEPQMDVMR